MNIMIMGIPTKPDPTGPNTGEMGKCITPVMQTCIMDKWNTMRCTREDMMEGMVMAAIIIML